MAQAVLTRPSLPPIVEVDRIFYEATTVFFGVDEEDVDFGESPGLRKFGKFEEGRWSLRIGARRSSWRLQ